MTSIKSFLRGAVSGSLFLCALFIFVGCGWQSMPRYNFPPGSQVLYNFQLSAAGTGTYLGQAVPMSLQETGLLHERIVARDVYGAGTMVMTWRKVAVNAHPVPGTQGLLAQVAADGTLLHLEGLGPFLGRMPLANEWLAFATASRPFFPAQPMPKGENVFAKAQVLLRPGQVIQGKSVYYYHGLVQVGGRSLLEIDSNNTLPVLLADGPVTINENLFIGEKAYLDPVTLQPALVEGGGNLRGQEAVPVSPGFATADGLPAGVGQFSGQVTLALKFKEELAPVSALAQNRR